MGLLKDSDRKELKEMFKELEHQVTIKYFTQEMECRFCKETHDLLDEVAGLSEKITLDVSDFIESEADAKKLGIEKIPGFAIIGEKDYGIRYYGIPSGYEFSSLIHGIITASKGKTDLKQSTRDELAKITKPIHLQVFVTPT